MSTPSLEDQIISQVEFYFSPSNLRRDKFMKATISSDPDGGMHLWLSACLWLGGAIGFCLAVPLSVLMTFNRLKKLSEDKDVILSALKKSENLIVCIPRGGVDFPVRSWSMRARRLRARRFLLRTRRSLIDASTSAASLPPLLLMISSSIWSPMVIVSAFLDSVRFSSPVRRDEKIQEQRVQGYCEHRVQDWGTPNCLPRFPFPRKRLRSSWRRTSSSPASSWRTSSCYPSITKRRRFRMSNTVILPTVSFSWRSTTRSPETIFSYAALLWGDLGLEGLRTLPVGVFLLGLQGWKQELCCSLAKRWSLRKG